MILEWQLRRNLKFSVPFQGKSQQFRVICGKECRFVTVETFRIDFRVETMTKSKFFALFRTLGWRFCYLILHSAPKAGNQQKFPYQLHTNKFSNVSSTLQSKNQKIVSPIHYPEPYWIRAICFKSIISYLTISIHFLFHRFSIHQEWLFLPKMIVICVISMCWIIMLSQ